MIQLTETFHFTKYRSWQVTLSSTAMLCLSAMEGWWPLPPACQDVKGWPRHQRPQGYHNRGARQTAALPAFLATGTAEAVLH